MKPLHYYYLGTGSWFLSYGIQTVAFAWIVTILLDESAKLVGIAQMAFLLPAMLFTLVGGSLADQFGGRKVVISGHLVASCAPLFLTIVITLDYLSYSMVLVFAIIMGCAQAFITPARDGLLALVAEGRIQRKVVQVSLIQFGVQMLGFLAASFADRFGAVFVLMIQFTILSVGTFSYLRLKVEYLPPTRLSDNMVHQVLHSLTEGYKTVISSASMRAVVIQNCATGIFFMGSYFVTVPLLIRELYNGSSTELSWVNTGNSLGLVTTILFLMKIGDIHRQGRALLTMHFVGSLALMGAGLGLGFYSLIGFIYLWGMSGGIAMTMSRTIMQEQAPPEQRARMMAFYSFSFMGAGPLGALFSGYLAEWLGPSTALVVSSTLMLVIVILVALRTTLWRLDSSPPV